MIPFLIFCAGVVVGILVGSHEEKCPRVIRGYSCFENQNLVCDHSRLARLEAQLDMERARIEREKQRNGGQEL